MLQLLWVTGHGVIHLLHQGHFWLKLVGLLLLRILPPRENTAMIPKSIFGRPVCHPWHSALHHVSRPVPSLILQWLHIIVPPVAGFNYSHDAKAQAVAAITSSITKNYCSANLQMHCLPVAVYVYVCAIYDKHIRSKLLMLVIIIFRWLWD